jgi:hypothetical protein
LNMSLNIFFAALGFEIRTSHLLRRSTTSATPPGLFCDGYFQDRVLRSTCPGWLWTLILLISASWVARIIGMSTGTRLPLTFLKLSYFAAKSKQLLASIWKAM